MVKNLPAMQENWVRSLSREDPLEKGKANPLQYSGLENPHGQRSLMGYSSWGRKESDTTERLSAQHKGVYIYWWFHQPHPLALGSGICNEPSEMPQKVQAKYLQ